ncbi:hypothetical protein KSP40_PGU014280 [Platanthera guangdongensis]|uniref:Uncharacterized protein n=1 Tax=Platanthera guangdongensis TaxID=2320717 RepID=A0ABR2N5R4_9ASPA
MNFDNGNSYNIFMDRNMSEGLGVNYVSHLCSFVDLSLHNSNHLVSSGSIALQEAFGCISKFAGALFIWLSTGSNPNNGCKMSANISHGSNVKNHQICPHVNRIKGWHFLSRLELQSAIPLIVGKFTNSTARRLLKEFGQYQVFRCCH